MSSGDLTHEPDVELRLPADGAFAYVLRTTAAALAARVDFTLDDIEDLKIAVSEAVSLLLEGADPTTDLRVGFTLSPGRMELSLTLPADDSFRIDTDGFAWQVLSTLASSTDLQLADGTVRLALGLGSSVGVA